MHENEITIIDMMKLLAPQKSMREILYSAMDDMSRATYTSDEARRAECLLRAWDAVREAVNMTYDRY